MSFLASAKNTAQARIEAAAAAWAPGASKAVSRGGRVSPLAIGLDGKPDKSTTDRRQLAANRIDEFMRAAPGIKDRLYQAVAPIAETQPALAPALHQAAVNSFNSVVSRMPKDPGAMSRMKSIWKPSDIEAAVLEKQLGVFQDPVGVAEDMLRNNRFDPISVEALKANSPETYRTLQFKMFERISQPGALDKTSYADQAALSIILGVDIHSSMSPRNIAAAQQIFTDRTQPLGTPKANGPGMAEPGNNPSATQSQISTSR